MPFKSKAQMAKFGVLVKEGKISKNTFDKWSSETKNISKLPKKAPSKTSQSLLRGPRRTAK